MHSAPGLWPGASLRLRLQSTGKVGAAAACLVVLSVLAPVLSLAWTALQGDGAHPVIGQMRLHLA
ncbi:MAG: hypothetical protein Q4G39_00290, partial [Brachymonas sp.]|nr:hypothetical protein [Brachymonas sp.]